MQFLTAKTLVYIRTVFIFFICFFLTKDPRYIGDAGFVLLLGQAMQVPYTPLDSSNPVLGMLTVALAMSALSDLLPAIADNVEYFESMVPTRLGLFFVLAVYSYSGHNSQFSCSIVIVYSFFEIWLNFLIYNNLRDEKYYRLKKFVEENGDKIKEMEGEQIRVVEVE